LAWALRLLLILAAIPVASVALGLAGYAVVGWAVEIVAWLKSIA